jgi:hypothetical protein
VNDHHAKNADATEGIQFPNAFFHNKPPGGIKIGVYCCVCIVGRWLPLAMTAQLIGFRIIYQSDMRKFAAYTLLYQYFIRISSLLQKKLVSWEKKEYTVRDME